MKKLMTILFACSLFMGVGLLAQDTMSKDSTNKDSMSKDSMSKDSMKADASTTKATHVTGKISDDGKTFVSDKDGKSWTINNPDAVKGHEGHHVVLKANVNADKTSVDVVSLKMASDKMKKDSMSN